MIHVILSLWLAWQVASPQAAQHMQAGIAADKQRQFDVVLGREHRHQIVELEHKADMVGAPFGKLAAGQVLAALGDGGLVTARHQQDLVMQVGHFGSAADIVRTIEDRLAQSA